MFCKIIARNAPASIAFQDDLVIAFMDIRPVNPDHTIVVPKVHYPYLDSIDEQTEAQLFKITMRTAQAIRRSGMHCEGINLFLADGEAAFQEIFHLHMHVTPRFKGDKFKISANWRMPPPREELEHLVKNIRDAFDR